LEEANALLEILAATDGLTRLKNRRAFQEKLSEEVKRASRSCTPLSLILLDVDHFKRFNDAFGHPAGDGVLCCVARLLETNVRSTDFVARYGGEEFAILLPDTDRGGAVQLAERVRRGVAGGEWRDRGVTVSVGVATTSLPDGTGEALVEGADIALYCSKNNGRNCVHHSGELGLAVQ
jgi:diguanylate cyclase (GGDEF)-like protein